jgi:hypothetical protein
MSQDNSKSAITILTDPKFALRLKRWNNDKKVKMLMRTLSGMQDKNRIRKEVTQIINTHPELFEHWRNQGFTMPWIVEHYYNKCTKYVS